MTWGLRAFLAAVAVAAPLLTGACTTNPATGRQSFTAFMSSEQEIEVGREQHPKILQEFGGEIEDAKIKAYVNALGQRLARSSEFPDLNWTFTVLNSDITNAFALPGGYVYVTRGLLSLASTEAELAGVLGHEIGHVTARHSAQRYSAGVAASLGALVLGVLTGSDLVAQAGQSVAGIALASYSREQELEADTLGVRYLARAGYDPTAMSTFLAKLQMESALEAELAGRPGAEDELNIMATHPRTQDRVQEAIAAARQQVAVPANPRIGRDEYLNTIDGMAYGGDRDSGFIRQRRFVHPALRLAFEVPPGFNIANGAASVSARGPANARIIFDRDARAETAGLDMVDYLQRVWARGARLQAVERIEINGMPAATGATRVQTNSGTMDMRLVAIRFDPRTICRFIFATPPSATAGYNEAFRRTTYSFRKLSESEAAAAQPPRIAVVTVKSGDTVESLARRMAFDTAQVQRFRVLNGLGPGEEVRPGQRVKIVVE
ncbi:MAG TPA: M48 family metalloprotease [Longimicrobiales bacterium]